MEPKIAVIYLSYRSGPYLGESLETLSTVRYPRDRWELVIVDNPVPGDDSARVIRDTVVPRGGVDLPKVTLIENATNLGYAGGMNTGIRYALEQGFDYVMLLNQDGEVDAGILEHAVRVAEADKMIGAVQCFIRLHPERQLVNSNGNQLHYLGLGWSGGYRLPVAEGRPSGVTDLAYASGAAVLYRLATLRDIGIFDEEMFLYHEDTDISWRMRLRGYRVVIAPHAEFFHKYEFTRSITKFYWILRNQWVLFFTLPKLRTIALLMPMQIFFQSAMLLASVRSGFTWQMLRAFGYFLKPKTWRYLRRRRAEMQAKRTVSDRVIYSAYASEIAFQDADNSLLRRIGNPMMRWYWKLVFPLIRW